MNRVGIIAIQHESNTFVPARTTLDQFREDRLLLGEDIRRSQRAAHHEVGGFFEGLEQEGLEAVPLLMAVAVPSGIVTAKTLDALTRMMWEVMARAGKLDGMLVAPHVAAVSEAQPDMDGHWLGLLRERLGDSVPVIGTLDLHANVSPAMVQATNALIAYRTNPHLDQRARGIDAARLMARTLRGEVRPTQALAMPPVAISMERQLTSEPPCRDLFDRAGAQLRQPRVLANSVILGFPYADVIEMGSSFIVVTDNDPALAQKLADESAGWLWANRQAFVAELISVEAALDAAAAWAKPVCLLDMGDNVGGGSPATGTAIAQALERRRDLRGFISLCDPEAVQQAAAAGPGARVRLRMGSPPLEGEVVVHRVTDGRFAETQLRHGGRTTYDMGSTVIVTTGNGLRLQLTSRRIVPFSLGQLTSCGVDPKSFDVIVAKGVHAPVAAYAPVCPTLIRVNTPGVTSIDLTSFTYRHRRRPLFPFENT